MTACPRCGDPVPVSKGRPRKWCSDNCRSRAWGEAQTSVCACGHPKQPHSARCKPCSIKARKVKRDAKRRRVAAMWAEGFTLEEIAVACDTTANAMSGEIVRMRHAGWEVAQRRAAKPTPPATKQQCRDQFHAALVNSRIRKPSRCERCAAVGPVDGHHPDYSRPLFVFWLCHACHAAEHYTPRERTVA